MSSKSIDNEYDNRDRYMKEFALRVSVLRNNKGVSAREMSISLDRNFGYINSIENCKASPSLKEFFSMCDYLEVTPGEFFSPFLSGSDKPDKRVELHSLLALLTDSQIDAIHSIVSDLTHEDSVI